MRCLVLDAMGVIFRAADDVAELLVPFIRRIGGCTSASQIESAYLDASLGIIGPEEFWTRVDLDATVEDEYLSGHALVPGADDFLRDAQRAGIPVWCLSNDVDRWSQKLRAAHNIEGYLAGAVISSQAKARKPDRRVYECLLARSGFAAGDLLFVDDRDKNVKAARKLGIPSLLFRPELGYAPLREQVWGGASCHENDSCGSAQQWR